MRMLRLTPVKAIYGARARPNPAFKLPFRSIFTSSSKFSNATPPTMIKRRKWPWIVLGLATIPALWTWYTWHEYPDSVAKILKKGLMAEINGGGYRVPDLKLALKYYLEALHEADAIEMSPISDEYTGIQLKIAEMYEHLGMPKEAAFVYMEVMGMYLVTLNSRAVGALHRDHMIKRDLMVSIMLGLVLKDPVLSRKMLLPHMDIALGRAAQNSQESLPVSLNPSLLLDFHDGQVPNLASKVSSENEKAWSEFRDEAFALREIMTIACIEQGDFWQAALFKYHTTLLMLSSGFGIGECLLSLSNIGSLACLEAINFQTVGESLTDLGVVNTEGVIPKPDPKSRTSPPGYLSVSSLDMVKRGTDLPSVFLDMSDKFYQNVRVTIEGLSGSKRRAQHVDDAYALAIFGQGVVAFKRGKLDTASELLHEARLRAKGCQLADLVETVGAELEKLDKIRVSGKPMSEFKPQDIPKINIAFWKIETPQLARPPPVNAPSIVGPSAGPSPAST